MYFIEFVAMLPSVVLVKLMSVKPAQRESDGQADSNRDEEAGGGWTGYLVRVNWFYGTPSLKLNIGKLGAGLCFMDR